MIGRIEQSRDAAAEKALESALDRLSDVPPPPPGLAARIVAGATRLPQVPDLAPPAGEVLPFARPDEIAEGAIPAPPRPFYLRRAVGVSAGLTAIAAGVAAIVLVHGTAFDLRPDEEAPASNAPSIAAIQPVLPTPALADARPVAAPAAPAPASPVAHRALRSTHAAPATPAAAAPQLASADTAPPAATPSAPAPAAPVLASANNAPSGTRVGPPVPEDLATTVDLPVAGTTPAPATGLGFRAGGER